MTAVEQAIREAFEKGDWNPAFSRNPAKYAEGNLEAQAFIFQMPSFWQALGKARGWNKYDDLTEKTMLRSFWLETWHRFIDHLTDGKNAEEFFTTLLL